ncbi:hypothetical protein ACQJBY_034395 [Aegilops geniculata]
MEQDAPPVPSHQAQDGGAVDGWARKDSEPPPVRRSGGVPRGRRSSSLPALPQPRLHCRLRVCDPQRRLCMPFNPLPGIHRLYCHLFLI